MSDLIEQRITALHGEFLLRHLLTASGHMTQEEMAGEWFKVSKETITRWIYNDQSISRQNLRTACRYIFSELKNEDFRKSEINFTNSLRFLEKVWNLKKDIKDKPPSMAQQFLDEIDPQPWIEDMVKRRSAEEADVKSPQPLLTSAEVGDRIFNYGYDEDDRIEVLGRDAEQEELLAFLDGPPGFMWLQLAGVAGQGKSRLAWELIQQAPEEGFRAGFMRAEALQEFVDLWRNWVPDKPHLIVIDYVVEPVRLIGRMMAALIEREDTLTHPVRLLLLERQRWDRGGISRLPKSKPDESGLRRDKEPDFELSMNEHSGWFEELARHAVSENGMRIKLVRVKHLFDGHGVLELQPLNHSALCAIVRHIVQAKTDGTSSDISDDAIDIALARFDAKGRPLYAYFIGIAIAAGDFSDTWRRHDLLSYVLTSDREKRWPTKFGEKPPGFGEDAPEMRVAVLATIVRAIPRFTIHGWDDWRKISDDDIEKALVLVNGPISSGATGPGDIIPGLAPDLLGEWFVLLTLGRQPNYLPDIMAKAWEYAPEACAAFLLRIAQDFPGDMSLERIVNYQPDNKASLIKYGELAPSILHELQRNKLNIPEASIIALKYAAEAGISNSMYALAQSYEYGWGVKHNYSHAFHWFQKLGELDDHRALNALGFYYENGLSVRQNLSLSVEFYKKAIEAGDVFALSNLGMSYEHGRGVNRNIIEAINLYRKGVDSGSGAAMVCLGACYENGVGLVQNLETSFSLYERAHKVGFTRAKSYLGVCYQLGRGVETNISRALELYFEAADLGDIRAMTHLGSCYNNGEGVKADHVQAVKWFRQAADHGDGRAMAHLGACLQHGRGIKQEIDQAIFWYERGVQFGDGRAMANLGNCYFGGLGVLKNQDKAAKLYLKGAESGDNFAMARTGYCYHNGFGFEKNFEKAFYWYHRGAVAGDASAIISLIKCYYFGRGVRANRIEATRWFQEAARRGDGDTMCNLGVMFALGDGIGQDFQKALEWYRKGADIGHGRAMACLGDCYRIGQGVPRDISVAAEWYRLGAERGDARAMTCLGDRYAKGEGVTKNPSEAISCYQNAAALGDEFALQRLDLFGNIRRFIITKFFSFFQKVFK